MNRAPDQVPVNVVGQEGDQTRDEQHPGRDERPAAGAIRQENDQERQSRREEEQRADQRTDHPVRHKGHGCKDGQHPGRDEQSPVPAVDGKADVERHGNTGQDGSPKEGPFEVIGQQPDGQGQGGADKSREEPAPLLNTVEEVTQPGTGWQLRRK